jgi:hypothetical protein
MMESNSLRKKWQSSMLHESHGNRKRRKPNSKLNQKVRLPKKKIRKLPKERKRRKFRKLFKLPSRNSQNHTTTSTMRLLVSLPTLNQKDFLNNMQHMLA